jgi:preprotein translocase subunit SecA
MRIFGGDRIKNLMGAMGMNDDEPIEAGMVTRAIERSQKRVETHHFEIRKHLLEYDDVMNKQRIFFYGLRTEILKGNTKDYVLRVAGEIAEGIANDFLPDKGERDLAGFRERVEQLFTLGGEEVDAVGQMPQAQATEALVALVQKYYEGKDERLGGEGMRSYERWSILQIIDAAWKRHLLVMDHLKEAIGFRGYGQKDPLVEYKRESYEYFEQMRFGYEDEIISYLYRVEPQPAYTPEEELFRGPADTFELGPDEQGNAPDGIQRVLRFTAGGLED